MAKKSFSFGDAAKSFVKSADKTGILFEDVNNQKEPEYVGTGIYMVNALLSGSILKGGIRAGRITAFAGEEGVGKSFLCYNICREAQKEGYGIFYIDTEKSIDLPELPKFGIDIDQESFMLVRSNVIEDLKITLTKFLHSLKEVKHSGGDVPKIMIVLDSVGMLGSRKEVEDALAGKEKADMTRAKALNSLFRIISSDLGYLDIPMIFTNHTYQTQDFFPQEIMKGGKGLYYAASSIVFLGKSKLKTGDEDALDTGQSGIKVRATIKKNRGVQPKQIRFEISFKHGCNPYKGLEEFLTADNFDQTGIGKGKWDGENFKPGGNKWYIGHLDKSVFEKRLHTSEVFTEDVLKSLDPIISDYFKYHSFEDENPAHDIDDELDQDDDWAEVDSDNFEELV